MRSLLFVPGDSERKLEKGLASGADVLIVDLEDSVAPDNKAAARSVSAQFIRAHRGNTSFRIYVRVNDLSTGLTEGDLAAVVPAGTAGIMLPKCNHAADVTQLSTMLRVHEAEAGLADGGTRVIPLITETAQGIFGANSYGDPDPRLEGLSWGSEDLSAAIGARASRDETGALTDVFRIARAVTILAASTARVAAIDTVYTDFRNDAGLRRECLDAERDGFVGKMAIHPAQVPVINEVFTPSREAVERSRAIVQAFEAAGNPGVVGIEGKMYDRPHLRLAERLLARARAAGVVV
jgi:citrate lyase subunit beta/citryl-CoA lyase